MEIGDIVKLKSGSPLMTVSGFDEDSVSVVWFDNHSRNVRTDRFYKAILKKIELPVQKENCQVTA
jgi:uncharacterized protein YodC (DUF2158 family)